ncbi:MAG: hypothetical protein SFV81_17175 [Pirellulaceae bacterium]|nr:hypothetical protein [Pirellulaceae bacterium]
MIQDSEQVDPYVTPRTLAARRPFRLSTMIMASVVLLTISASAFIINNARGRSIHLHRSSNALKDYMPYLEREVTPASNSK